MVLGFQNFLYGFWGVGEDVWRWLFRQVRRKNSPRAKGGLSRGLSVRWPRSEDPHWRPQNFYITKLLQYYYDVKVSGWLLLLAFVYKHAAFMLWSKGLLIHRIKEKQYAEPLSLRSIHHNDEVSMSFLITFVDILMYEYIQVLNFSFNQKSSANSI